MTFRSKKTNKIRELIWTGNTWETDYPYNKGGLAPWAPACKFHLNGANLIICSGQVPYDERGRIVAPESIRAQTELVMENIKQVLDAAGATAKDIGHCRIYIVKEFMHDYATKGARIYNKWFADNGVPEEELPPQTLIGVARLSQNDIIIEIDVIACTEA
jgi:2-iminobutanoate/2-iminopropanoate deaminase